MKYVVFSVMLILSVVACDDAVNEIEGKKSQEAKVEISASYENEYQIKRKKASSQVDTQTLLAAARNVAAALKEKRIEKLNLLIDPVEGLTFSPYSGAPLFFTKFDREMLSESMASKKKYIWGRYNGSGDTIELSMNEYIDRFVFDINYFSLGELIYINNPEKVYAYDLNAVVAAYPRHEIAIYHFKGTEAIGFKDFKTLIFVLKDIKGSWYLISIIHSESTV